MFSQLAIFSTLALSLLAAATPALVARNEPAGDCNTGDLQCCDSTETAGSASGAALLSLVGVVLQDPSILLGVTCSPISAIGVGSGSSCSASPVCCSDNSFGTLVSIGCVPVTL